MWRFESHSWIVVRGVRINDKMHEDFDFVVMMGGNWGRNWFVSSPGLARK